MGVSGDPAGWPGQMAPGGAIGRLLRSAVQAPAERGWREPGSPLPGVSIAMTSDPAGWPGQMAPGGAIGRLLRSAGQGPSRTWMARARQPAAGRVHCNDERAGRMAGSEGPRRGHRPLTPFGRAWPQPNVDGASPAARCREYQIFAVTELHLRHRKVNPGAFPIWTLTAAVGPWWADGESTIHDPAS